MSRSASNESGVQMLFTCREQLPAPRSSTGTSDAGTYRGRSRRRARAEGSATRAECRLVSVTVASRGRYAKSVTAEKTSGRPASSKRSPSTCTAHEPASGRATTSSSAVSSRCEPPAGSSSTRSPEYAQPASSGATATAYGPSSVLPAARCSFPLMPAPPASQLADRGVHCTGDVVVRRVQQGPPGDDALDGGQLQRLAPAAEHRLRIPGHLAPEQQRRQRGGRHHPLHVVDHGHLEPAVRGGRAEPGGDGDGPDHRFRAQVVANPAVDPVRGERLDHGH